jgi:hypothetical protein
MGFPWKLVTKRHGGGGELFLHQWTQAIQHYLHNFTTIIAMLMLETTSARCEALVTSKGTPGNSANPEGHTKIALYIYI